MAKQQSVKWERGRWSAKAKREAVLRLLWGEAVDALSRAASIRRLPVVATEGWVSVVCSDKTATVTRNEMTVRSSPTASGDCAIDGVGYVPRDGRKIEAADPLVLVRVLRPRAVCQRQYARAAR